MKQMKFFLLIAAAVMVTAAGCQTPGNAADHWRTISVSGEGTVSQSPDIVRFTVGYAVTRDTTQEAQSTVNRRINEVMEMLLSQGVEEKNIRLSQLTVSPEYGWIDNERELRGQRVRQSLHVTVVNLPRLGTILDSLGSLQGIEISSVSFSIGDATKLYSRAREIAFGQALSKAQELALLSGMTLGSPVSIIEDSLNRYQEMPSLMMRTEMADSSSVVPEGEMEISVRVSVTFEMQR